MTAIEAIRDEIGRLEYKVDKLKEALACLEDEPSRNGKPAPSAPVSLPKVRTPRPKPAGDKPKQDNGPRGMAGSNIAKVLKFLNEAVIATAEVIIQKTGLTRDEFDAVCRNHSERLTRTQKGVSTSPWQLTATGKADAAKLPKDWE